MQDRYIQDKGIYAVSPLAAFVSTNVLNDMAIEVFKKDGLAGLTPIIPFIDTKMIEDYIIKNMNDRAAD